MITITILKNPFNHNDKEIYTCEHVPGKTAYEYIQPYIMGLDNFVVSMNGEVVEDVREQMVNSDDWLAVCPVVGKSGSDWFRAIGMLVLGNWTGGLAKSLSTQWINTFGGASGFWASMAAGAVGMIGGALINHWFPPSQPDRPQTSTANPSYNWNSLQSLTGQGNALAVTYGTMRTAGQVIAQHVSSNGDNQYLNILLCGGEGPVDNISDIRINDNPISYYKDIIVETRLGANDQSAIANFNDTYADQALAYELNTDNIWATQQTEGNAVEGLELTLELPGGLYHVKDDGGLENASVTVQAQYRKVGDANWSNFTDGKSWSVTQSPRGQLNMISVNSAAPTETWTITRVDPWTFTVSGSVSGVKPNAKVYENYNNGLIAFNIKEYWWRYFDSEFSPGDTFTIHVAPNINLQISAAQNTAFRRTYRIDHLSAAQYEVRVLCVAKSGTDTRYSTRVFWTQLSSIMYDDFARPGKVLVGIKALATNQLSGGMPSITWLQTRNSVWVVNADTGQYEQKPATNPAWSAYDMIHRCRQIKNVNTGNYEFIAQGAPASRAVYQDFINWAAFCDSRSLTFNYIYDAATDLWTALQKPESVGRGKVIMRGTRYGCVCDAPGQPVQLFTVGNIITDQFKETFVGLKDRANAIEITFVNKDKGYQKDVITVYADDYDSASEPNITQITLDGATTTSQAYREGKYRLRLNQYLQRTVEHSADIDAIACQINDIVLLAHDVPQWGFSGRLLAATDTTLQLDRKVTLEPGKSYAIAVQITDPAATTPQTAQRIVTVSVQGVGQEISTDTVTVTGSLPKIPSKWDLYSFGETNKVVKPFRVLNISRDQDMRRKISCLEYIEEIYTEAETIPEINYSALDTTLAEVTGVSTAEETYRQKDGTIVSNLNVSWMIPRNELIVGYEVLYSIDDGDTWILWATGVKALSTSIIGVKTNITYLVKVCIINDVGQVSSGVISAPVLITGKDAPPSDVAQITATIDPSDSTKIHLSWSAVDDIDLSGYRLSESGSVITATPITDTQYVYTAATSRQYNFSVVAVDNSGNPSQLPATITTNVTVEPDQVTGFTIVQKAEDRAKAVLSWAANSESDISFYEIRMGDNWNSAAMIVTQLKATSFEYTLSSEGSISFLIKAVNTAGNYSVNPTVVTQQYNLKPNAPVSGSISQSIQDKSIITISWAAITDKDLKEYEIRLGTDWATGTTITTTKETSCQYKLSAGGTYNFMICSRSVAGYVSAVLNLPISADLSPSNVTGFSVAASLTDRRILNCQWNAVSDPDLLCYEIRQGTNWDTATPVAQQVKGNFCSIQFAGGSATLLIKAINVSGHYSDAAASYAVAIPAAPNIPGAGSVIADSQNRFKLTISWGAVTDTDIQDYEVRLGSTWAAATNIKNTKETNCQYTVSAGGAYTFLVASRTVGSQYSQPRTLAVAVVQEPSDVTAITAAQSVLDRRTINLAWQAVTDSDLAGYEIRKGASWDAAVVVATGLKTNKLDYIAAVEEPATFLVKAITVGGKYSVNAVAANITIQLRPNAPANGTCTVDTANSVVQILSWDAVSDTDLVYYEIREGGGWAAGTLITTTKEHSYRYTCASSGSYNFMVAALNIGGYYSAPLNISFQANIEPQTPTGFSATQSISDRTRVTLLWDKPASLDVAYYEIRLGATWDTGTIIGSRVTGAFFDYIVAVPGQADFWIKAVNAGGKYSLSPAHVAGSYNLSPDTPTNLVITQDTNDRSRLILSWAGITESDFLQYDVRCGLTWDSATSVISTKETTCTYSITASGVYKFIIKAKNTGQFYSDELSNTMYAAVEPANVTNFSGAQNGETVLLQWDKSPDNDVAGFEIRQGGSFANGQVVASGITLQSYTVPVGDNTYYQYTIKAINRSGHYSQSEAVFGINVTNIPPKNVILATDEIALQNGTHSSTAFGASTLTFATLGGKFSDYPTTKFSDIGGATVLRLVQNGSAYYTAGTYTCRRINVGSIITANITATFVSTVLLQAGLTAKLQYRLSQDGTNFTPWADFVPVQATFQYLEFQVLLATSDITRSPEVNQLVVKIDVPDELKYGSATIAVGGTTVPYGYTYYSEAHPLPTAIGSGLRAELVSIDLSGFVCKVVRASDNTDVGGQITWQCNGF